MGDRAFKRAINSRRVGPASANRAAVCRHSGAAFSFRTKTSKSHQDLLLDHSKTWKTFRKGLDAALTWTPACLRIPGKCQGSRVKKITIEGRVMWKKQINAGKRSGKKENRSGKKKSRGGGYFRCRRGSTYRGRGGRERSELE